MQRARKSLTPKRRSERNSWQLRYPSRCALYRRIVCQRDKAKGSRRCQCVTVSSYQVVTAFPIGISHPPVFFSTRIGSLIGWPEPSSGCAETALARSKPRRVIRPTTASIRGGDPPHSERLLRR